MSKKRISFYLPVEIDDQIRLIKKKTRLTTSAIVQLALEDHLPNKYGDIL